MGVQLDETEKRIVDLIEANRDEIIAFARDMYTHAELGYKEFKTAEKFTRLMKKLNLPVKEHLAVTGVKAYLNEERLIPRSAPDLHCPFSLRLNMPLRL